MQHEKGRDVAKMQKEHYGDAGFKMLREHATWQEGGNSVESGLYLLQDLMAKGQFKVFNDLFEVMEEIRQYHRNELGKIVKVKDDLIDAIRYAFMMKRYAVRYGEVGKKRRPIRVIRSV